MERQREADADRSRQFGGRNSPSLLLCVLLIPSVTMCVLRVVIFIQHKYHIFRRGHGDDWGLVVAFKTLACGGLLGLALACPLGYLYWKGFLPTWVAAPLVVLGFWILRRSIIVT